MSNCDDNNNKDNNNDNNNNKDNNNNNKVLLESILDTEYIVYTYLTPDYKPGAVIVDPKFRPIFDEKNLFEMESLKSTTIKLRDVLKKGFISVGSTDLMESIDITHPHKYIVEQSGARSVIKGRYFHGSRRELIAEPTGIDFTYDPVSDNESEDKSDDKCDDKCDYNCDDYQNDNLNNNFSINDNDVDYYQKPIVQNDCEQPPNPDETVTTDVNANHMPQNDLRWLCDKEVV